MDLIDRHARWLGGLSILFGLAIALLSVAIGSYGGFFDDGELVWGFAIVGGFLGLGALLVAKLRPARWLAALGLVVLAVFSLKGTIGELGGDLVDAIREAPLLVANMLAMTVLTAWLCASGALHLLRAPAQPPRSLTARIAGVAIALVAASHVSAAIQADVPWLDSGFGRGTLSGVSLSISSTGASIYGFFGWPLWHVLAGIAGLALAITGRGRIARVATTALIGLVIYVAASGLVFDSIADFGSRTMIAAVAAILIYLFAWLRSTTARSRP